MHKALISLALAAVVASNGAQAHKDKPDPIGNWALNDPTWQYQESRLVDTDPSSRPTVASYLANKHHLSKIALSDAHRLHIPFRPDQAELTDQDKLDISHFMSLSNPSSRVIVAGFSSEDGEFEHNQALAASRAKAIADFVLSEFTPGRLTVTSSASALSIGQQGLRGEIWIIRGLR